MIGVATEPPVFLEISALKRVVPASPVAAQLVAAGGPPDAAVARAYAVERPDAERPPADDAAQEQLRSVLSELLRICPLEPSAAAQSAAAAISWSGRVVSDGLLGMAGMGTLGLEAALEKFRGAVEPTPTPATVGTRMEPLTLILHPHLHAPPPPPSPSTPTLTPTIALPTGWT